VIRPGAFDGVAVSGPCLEDDLPVTADTYELPAGLLVHWSHGWCDANPDLRPVAVAVPTRVGQEIRIHGVFASSALHPWNAITHGVHDRLSIVNDTARIDYSPVAAGNFTSLPGGGIVAAGWPLVAVDFVDVPADEGAGVTEVYPELTDAEREVQQRLDRYLADPGARLAIEYLALACDEGVDALAPLRALVEPMLAVEAVR